MSISVIDDVEAIDVESLPVEVEMEQRPAAHAPANKLDSGK